MNHTTCSCSAAQLVKLSLRGEDLPACPVHRPDQGGASDAPIALNNDAALAARLGMPLNKENI